MIAVLDSHAELEFLEQFACLACLQCLCVRAGHSAHDSVFRKNLQLCLAGFPLHHFSFIEPLSYLLLDWRLAISNVQTSIQKATVQMAMDLPDSLSPDLSRLVYERRQAEMLTAQ